MFLLVPAYPGCPGQTAVKWLLLLLLTQFCSSSAMSMVASFPIFLFLLLLLLMFSLPTTAITIASVSLAAASVAPLTLYILTDVSGRPTAVDQVRAQLDVELVRTRGAKYQPWRRLRQPTTSTSRRLPSTSISSLALVE